jgi:hypothetical protein
MMAGSDHDMPIGVIEKAQEGEVASVVEEDAQAY